MARPSLRRALRRAGLPLAPPRARKPSTGVPPVPRIFLPGEDPEAGPLDLHAFFGRSAPTELEIGIGKARFLLAEAQAHPERNYIGLEIVPEYARIAEAKAEKLGLTNVRIHALDGKAFVAMRLPPGSLAALHVFFPDPWPKKRHHKRRLFTHDFAAAAARTLAPGGVLRAASDHPDYWPVIEQVLDAEPLLARIPPAETGDWTPGTNWELKTVARGEGFGRGIWRRK
jgi:tRNA (guanine-N7-)-methyltransferase